MSTINDRFSEAMKLYNKQKDDILNEFRGNLVIDQIVIVKHPLYNRFKGKIVKFYNEIESIGVVDLDDGMMMICLLSYIYPNK